MGVRGAKSWEGGGGFKVIIHHIGKRWGQFSSWGGGGVNPTRQNQTSSKILLHFSFHAILYYIYYIYIYIYYIYYNIILYILYYIYYIILYYIYYI